MRVPTYPVGVSLVRDVFSGLARNDTLGPIVASSPLGRGLVERIAGGDGPQEVMAAVEELTDSGRFVALERAWSVQDDPATVIADYEAVVAMLAASGLGSVSEVVVSAGLLELPRGFEAFAELCAQAQDCRVAVMLAPQDPEQVDGAITAVARQQALGRDAGIVLPAALRRTERDCGELVGRVRIVKGTAGEDPRRFGHAIEVDKSFVRCSKALLARGDAVQPSFATHDGRLIDIIQTLAGRYRRDRLQMEFALYLGRSGGMQQRLVDSGEQVRIYVPFGPQWFGRLVGGLDDRPAGLGAAVRSLLPGA